MRLSSPRGRPTLTALITNIATIAPVLQAVPRPYPLLGSRFLLYKTVRSDFEQKLQRQIDSCGPCCSCLVIIVMLALFGIYVLGR